MAITINGKEYDENDLSDEVKNSILQVQNSNNAVARLKAEILNHQILAQHHSKNIQDNLPADEEAPTEEATIETAEAPAETATE